MTFLQLMREAYRARKAGVTSAVAIMAACHDDEHWDMVFDRLVKAAKLEASLKKFMRRKKW